jgi:metal-responsive CopG/Arc/MetJ family transcriptional regulator
MKHNISITMEQTLFRELEKTRGREKRSTFIEHLIILGLKDFASKNEKKTVKACGISVTLLPIDPIELIRKDMPPF